MTPIDLAWRIILYSSAVPLTVFIVFYASLSQWRATELGKVLMGLAVAIDAMLIVGLSALLFGQWSGISVVRIVLYAAMHAGAWRMLAVLRRIQRTRCDGTVDPALHISLLRRRPRREPRKDQP